jgi:hypothetical protein
VVANNDVLGIVVYRARFPDVFRMSTARAPGTKIGVVGGGV